jgi:protease IV
MKVLVRILAVIGALAVLMVLLLMFIGVVASGAKGHIPSKVVLEIDLEKGLPEAVPQDPVAELMNKKELSLRDVIDTLDAAGNDDRVAGVVARIGGNPFGMAQLQELRDAVQRFRAKKKFAIAYSETFGEVGSGTGSYYLATAFDEIWLQPSGDVNLTGIILEAQFLRGTLDKLGVKFRGDHRYEYKNAMNTYTDTKMDQYFRESMEKVQSSWFSQIVKGIADSRKLKEEEVRALIDRGPYLGKEALDARLVDKMAYRDEVFAEVKKRGGDAEILFASKYWNRLDKKPNTSGDSIALIYGVGGIQRGKTNYDPVFGSSTMGSETVAAAFRSAIEDDSVKAIIFRIDCPGGSYVASDTVYREVMRAKQAGKPVIATFGNLAGSGGYFVAMGADKIVAQPGTITASIGVLGGKFLTNGFWEKIGISFDEVHSGANARMYNGSYDYSPAEWARFQAWLDRVYSDFTTKVADGRKIDIEKVKQIAKGRIWSGEDAKALGLVDEIGGYETALKLAKQAAKISADKEVNIRVFPRKQTALEAWLDEGGDNSEHSAELQAVIRTLETIQPIARKVRSMDIDRPEGVLTAPVNEDWKP